MTMRMTPLSGLMLPMAPGPAWLDVPSRFVPFRCRVDAVREVCVNPYPTAYTLYGALVAVAFTAPAVTVGTRVFRTAAA